MDEAFEDARRLAANLKGYSILKQSLEEIEREPFDPPLRWPSSEHEGARYETNYFTGHRMSAGHRFPSSR